MKSNLKSITDFPTFGNKYDACLALGVVLAGACRDRIIAKYGCFPGLWIYGDRATGKTTTARLLASMWPAGNHTGLSLESSSIRSLQTILSSYECVWFDDFYSKSASHPLEALLRDGFEQGEPLRVFIVSGQDHSQDLATCSRFVHVRLTPAQRGRGDALGASHASLREIGSFLAASQFASRLMDAMRPSPSDRTGFCYFLAATAFIEASRLLGEEITEAESAAISNYAMERRTKV